MYPLKFEPIYKQRIWGGQRLRGVFGKDLPAGEKIGESWELADLPQDKSVIANGDLAGQTLIAAVRKYPKQMTGDEDFAGPFPLLIKFLNAEADLSVQVHPDAQTCRRMGRGEPKTECWYIVSAEPGAVIYKGLKKGVTKEQFARAVETGDVAGLLAKIAAQAGDCHFLPAGTAHTLGAGNLVAEIQTPSDTTYRVFDWNRLDDSGKPRQLHIEEALESINFKASGAGLPVTRSGRLVDCEYFKIDKDRQTKGCELRILPPLMKVLIILTGSGLMQTKQTPVVDFQMGDCLLLPAAYEGTARFSEDTEYLMVTLWSG
ncbi:MAG: type I phosphomannose isomerase catalytic subunit [Planctomycetota bacterium]|jgi:mannose-6-phosphate isomerase